MTSLGVDAFVLAPKLDARGAVRLFPHGSDDPRMRPTLAQLVSA